ncbi:MAG TPA: hypothetical protein VM118_04205, partial [Acidobacteriota bacterium]|nr:hypothetical protein [Acidobacteriota bacterium]
SPGATNFGKALEHLDSDRWDPAARELYLNVHRNFRRARLFIHGGEDPRAVVVPGLAGSPAGLEVAAFPPDVAEYGSAGLPAIYIACIVLAALGGMIVAYEAGSYASKSVPAGVALDQANLGKLVTAAVEQIAKTGKIDPGLAKTIALWKPPSSSWGGWVLAGGLVLGAGGLAVATYYGNKRGR